MISCWGSILLLPLLIASILGIPSFISQKEDLFFHVRPFMDHGSPMDYLSMNELATFHSISQVQEDPLHLTNIEPLLSTCLLLAWH